MNIKILLVHPKCQIIIMLSYSQFSIIVHNRESGLFLISHCKVILFFVSSSESVHCLCHYCSLDSIFLLSDAIAISVPLVVAIALKSKKGWQLFGRAITANKKISQPMWIMKQRD